MNTDFKNKDIVRLSGVQYCPNMVVSEVNQETQIAKCVWYDRKAKKIKTELVPLNVLEIVTGKPGLDADELIRTAYRL